MLGIGAEKWFSLFKRGVELLADMSTFQFSATTPAMESRGQLPRPLKTGNVKGKISHGRQILVQKAKAASSRRQHLGMASHNKWAWRPTETGHGVQKISSSLEKIWCKSSFPTDATSIWPRRPQIGLLQQQNGTSCPGISPSWANTVFQATCNKARWVQVAPSFKDCKATCHGGKSIRQIPESWI